MIRFISAVLVGILCVVTKDHDYDNNDNNNNKNTYNKAKEQDSTLIMERKMVATPADRIESGGIVMNRGCDHDDENAGGSCADADDHMLIVLVMLMMMVVCC